MPKSACHLGVHGKKSSRGLNASRSDIDFGGIRQALYCLPEVVLFSDGACESIVQLVDQQHSNLEFCKQPNDLTA